MKAFIFGRHSVGDKVILSYIRNALDNSEYLGEKVDLSKINPEEGNLIVVTNPSILKTDIDRVRAYINKDRSKPMVVVKKVKTFATVFFKPNYEIENITTNKAHLFAGILYLPRKYFEKLPPRGRTMSKIFRTVPNEDWNVYIINARNK